MKKLIIASVSCLLSFSSYSKASEISDNFFNVYAQFCISNHFNINEIKNITDQDKKFIPIPANLLPGVPPQGSAFYFYNGFKFALIGNECILSTTDKDMTKDELDNSIATISDQKNIHVDQLKSSQLNHSYYFIYDTDGKPKTTMVTIQNGNIIISGRALTTQEVYHLGG